MRLETITFFQKEQYRDVSSEQNILVPMSYINTTRSFLVLS